MSHELNKTSDTGGTADCGEDNSSLSHLLHATSGGIFDSNSTPSDSEEDTLMRLTQQARQRSTNRFYDLRHELDDSQREEWSDYNGDGDYNNEDDNDDNSDDDNDEEMGDEVGPSEYFQHILLNRRRNPFYGYSDGDEDDEGQGQEDDDDEDDDNNDNDHTAEFLRTINSLSGESGSAAGAAALMSRLMGVGGGGLFFGGSQDIRGSSEINALISNLEQRMDPYLVMESLNELAERLLMMNALTAERSIPSNRLAKCICSILEDPTLLDDLELQLVACRCLYNLLEVNIDFVHDAVENNAVEALGNKLMEVSYIDLTEQCLQALEMIARDPTSHSRIVANPGLGSVLDYLDFLTIHAQRKCFIIVSKACTSVLVANFNMVSTVFTRVAQIVQNHTDSVVVENGWLAISRIITSFKLKPDLLDELFKDKSYLLKEMSEIIMLSCNKSKNSETGKVTIPHGSVLSLLKSLIVLASVSIDVSRVLLTDCNIGAVIIQSLNKFAKTQTDNISIETLMAVPKDLLSSFLSLIGYLLPISYTPKQSPFLSDDHKDFPEKEALNESRCNLCQDIVPKEYTTFVDTVWVLLVNSYLATMDYEIRRMIFVLIYRIVSFAPASQNLNIKDLGLICTVLASVTNLNVYSIGNNLPQTKGSALDVDMMDSSDEEHDEVEHEADPGLKKQDSDHENNEGQQVQSGSDSYDNGLNFESKDINEEKSNPHKIRGLVLLLSSFSIADILISKDPKIILLLEREGFISDTITVMKSLIGKIEEELPTSLQVKLVQFLASYTNKFLDNEFSNGYGYIFQFRSNKLLSEILMATQRINEKYTTLKNSLHVTSLSQMKTLQHINLLLNGNESRAYDYDSWENLWAQLKGVIASEELSSFELVSSKIFETLARVLTTDTSECGYEFSDCYKSFIKTFFVHNDRTIENLMDKLQETLTRSESFDIVSSGVVNPSGANTENGYAQTAIMAKQVKLRMSPEDTQSSSELFPSETRNMILSVHAIATFKSVDTFLKNKLQFIDGLKNIAKGPESNDDSDEKERLNIEFLINGEVVPNEITIYGAVYRSLQTRPDEIINPSKIWTGIHNVTYRKSAESVDKDVRMVSPVLLPAENDSDIYNSTTLSILKLLRVLSEMNSFAKDNLVRDVLAIPEAKFRNWKLTVKLNRQLEEPLIVASGTLPGWSINTTREYPFIFPLETRLLFLQSTSFGYSRLIHQWQIRTNQAEEENSSNVLSSIHNQRPQLGRPTRHKVRISRKMILQSAVKVLGLYGSTPGILEIEYYDEVGTGLGPTLEFYASVSKEFVKKKLRLWRDSDAHYYDDEAYITNDKGLFPLPFDKNQLASENGRKVLQFFACLGKFIARALLDSRIIDFNFNPVFLRLVQYLNYQGMSPTSSTRSPEKASRDIRKVTNLSSLHLVDPQLADSLEHLLQYVKQFENVEELERDSILVDGATIKDLSIYFELPGYPDYELIPNGSKIQVTASNLESYVNKVVEATLYSGIIHQTRAFMDGFSKVFPINSLVLFSPDELAEMFGRGEEDWSMESLRSAIHANHGYNKESQAINFLISILASFSIEERRKFLQFLTGSPKLPIGGFKSLRPELTVVRKHPEDNLSANDYLPSVMTCANYLKLPNYSSEKVMKQRLLQAISDGAGAFLLS